ESTRIHRSWPEAEASAARVAREDTELLEPIFQRKCLLTMRLVIPAGCGGLASIRWIGGMLGSRRRSFGGRQIGSDRRLSGRHLSGRYSRRLYQWRCLPGRSEHARQKSR